MPCGGGFTAQGEVRLIGAQIGGQLSFDGATLINPSGVALDLEGVRTPTLVLRPQLQPQGMVDLTNAQVDSIVDSQATWPQDLHLNGFRYGDLFARPEVGAKARLRWLERNPGGYSPQLYEQLAAAYRRAGRDDDARKVAIKKQRRRRQTLNPRLAEGFEPAVSALCVPRSSVRMPCDLGFLHTGRDRSCPPRTADSRCLADPARTGDLIRTIRAMAQLWSGVRRSTSRA
jgi:hypothetical protein